MSKKSKLKSKPMSKALMKKLSPLIAELQLISGRKTELQDKILEAVGLKQKQLLIAGMGTVCLENKGELPFPTLIMGPDCDIVELIIQFYEQAEEVHQWSAEYEYDPKKGLKLLKAYDWKKLGKKRRKDED